MVIHTLQVHLDAVQPTRLNVAFVEAAAQAGIPTVRFPRGKVDGYVSQRFGWRDEDNPRLGKALGCSN